MNLGNSESGDNATRERDGRQLADFLREQAAALGFTLFGIAPAVTPAGFPRLLEWLDLGYAGEMGYIERRREAYRHPQQVQVGCRSVIMVGMSYKTAPTADDSLADYRVAQYAQGGVDYHDLLRDRLGQLANLLHARVPNGKTRIAVDTAPLLERDFARLAGLGWFGKNTMLINKWQGSQFVLGAILTDFELPCDQPFETNHCGTCTRCLDACPTDAFPQPGVLDATRCISYWTIELKGSIPESDRHHIGNWLFGCDICQDVCPWNRKPATTTVAAFQGNAWTDISARDIVAMSEETFQQHFEHTPLARPGYVGLRRNALLVLANRGETSAVDVVRTAMSDPSPIIRENAAWALARLTGNVQDQDR